MSVFRDFLLSALVASVVTLFLGPWVNRLNRRLEASDSRRAELVRIYSEVADKIEAPKHSREEPPEEYIPGDEFADVPEVPGARETAKQYDPDLPEIEQIGQRLLAYLFGLIAEYEPDLIGDERLLQGLRAVAWYLQTPRYKRRRRRKLLADAKDCADRLRIDPSGRHQIHLDRTEFDHITARQISAIIRPDDEDHRRLRRGDWAELNYEDEQLRLRITDVSTYPDVESLLRFEGAEEFDPETAQEDQVQALQEIYPTEGEGTRVLAVRLDLRGLRTPRK